jgi:hypothetical protein
VATGAGHSGGMLGGTVAPLPLVVCHGCGPGVSGLGAYSGLDGDAPGKAFTGILAGGDGGGVFGRRSACCGGHLVAPPPLHRVLWLKALCDPGRATTAPLEIQLGLWHCSRWCRLGTEGRV